MATAEPLLPQRRHHSKQEIRERVGRNIRVLLEAADRSPKELAAHLGWDESLLYRRVRGETRITVDELDDIAGFFEIDPGLLLAPTEELVRSRCFSVLAEVPGQEILPGMSSDMPRPALAAV